MGNEVEQKTLLKDKIKKCLQQPGQFPDALQRWDQLEQTDVHDLYKRIKYRIR